MCVKKIAKIVLISIGILSLTLASGFAQSTVSAERIDALCDAIEKDFRASVVAKMPLKDGELLFVTKSQKDFAMGMGMGMESIAAPYDFKDYLQYAYAPEKFLEDITDSAPIVTRQTVKEGELLRIGEGYLKWGKAKFFKSDDECPCPKDMTEAVYYFLNGTLIKIRILAGNTSYNFNPCSYWIHVRTAETVFNKGASKTRYFFDYGPLKDKDDIKYLEEKLLRKNINATPERAYQLLEKILRKHGNILDQLKEHQPLEGA